MTEQVITVTDPTVRNVTVTDPTTGEETVVTVETEGPTGRGIVSVTRTAGDGSPGSYDTYTILFTDSTTTTFTVYNGADGGAACELAVDPTLVFENALL